MGKKKLMKIRELVTRSGVPRTTIHYYIREGLLHHPLKTGRTMAYYDESHLIRLQFIAKMKKDMPIRFIQELLSENIIPEQAGVLGEADPDKREYAVKNVKPGRKKQIIKESIRVFSKKGYRSTTINDITQALGISTGTFYKHFTNKQDIFVAVIDDVLQNIIEKSREATLQETDPLKKIFIRGRVFYANYSKYSQIINQLRAEMVNKPWAREKIENVYRNLTGPLIYEVGELIEAGIFRNVDPELFTYTLVGIIEMMSLRMTFNDRYSYDEIDNFLMDMIIKGFPYIPETAVSASDIPKG